MFLRFKTFVLLISLIVTGVSAALAQENTAKTEKRDRQEKRETKPPAADPKNPNAEQVAEGTILIYSGFLGRQNLDQIRKTTFERGKIIVTSADGRVDSANYERWVLRGENLEKERIRLDQEYPGAKYALIYNGEKIFGVYNDSVFTPREDAAKSFQNQIWRGLDALLRYKENGSTLELAGREKILGVELYLLDITDKQGRKTRFYISTKTSRVMQLEYEEDGINYRRKFYDYNYAQGTLVPYRSVLWANDKQVEETQVYTITFGQRVEENLFQEG